MIKHTSTGLVTFYIVVRLLGKPENSNGQLAHYEEDQLIFRKSITKRFQIYFFQETFLNYTIIDEVNFKDIKSTFQKNSEYSCIFPFVSRKSDIFLSQVLKTVLQEISQEDLFVHLEYAVNELSMNASKGNSKRLYFKKKGLDIHNPSDYEIGMGNFKENVFMDFKSLEQEHIDNNYFVNVKFISLGKQLKIQITNNSPLTDEEHQRISLRLKMAHKFSNLQEVLAHEFDTSEGGGIGLIMIVLMLRKLTLNERAISYQNEGSCSITTINIPLNVLSKDHGVVLAEEISKEILQMPQFPQSILNLQNELRDPNCSFESVARTIKSDSNLSAEILRIANSPVYRFKSKITEITGAVQSIGFLGVKAVLYNYGVNKVLSKRYQLKKVEEINNHSYQVALIASFLARYKKLNRIVEDVYIAALLHDMGKIIIKAITDDLEEKLTKMCSERHISISVLEDLTDGYSHPLIGSEVAKKWNFPEKYINPIAYHHKPLEVDDQYKVLTYTIYLGNQIYYYMKGQHDFYDINFMVLSFFGLEQEEQFDEFIISYKMDGI